MSSSVQFPYGYSVYFNGVPFHDEWPLINIPMENFGKGNCEPFVGGMNHRPVVLPFKDKNICSIGSPKLVAVVLDSDSAFGGTFDIHYKGSTVKSIPVTISASKMEIRLRRLPVVFTTLEISKRDIKDRLYGVSWVIKYSTNEKIIGLLMINDRYVTGRNAKVHVYPMLNVTTISNVNDLEGDFRIHLSGEETGPISHKATHKKILSELHKMDGVGKAIMVGSYYGSKSTSVKLNVLVDSS